MNLHINLIGEATLNISFYIYLLYFIPQLLYNQIYQRTKDISLVTNTLMLCANSFNLIYAFGFDFQWQYKATTIILLICISIQQLQIYFQNKEHKIIIKQTILFFIILSLSLIVTFYLKLNSNIVELIGFISTSLYVIYWFPQIYKNFKIKIADGFSSFYLLLAIFASSCDFISALIYKWPLPSILCPLIIIPLLTFVFYQKRIYKKD